MFQVLTVLSSDADTSTRPSGVKSHCVTASLCPWGYPWGTPRRTRMHSPTLMTRRLMLSYSGSRHTRRVQSSEAEASLSQEELKVLMLTASECPENSNICSTRERQYRPMSARTYCTSPAPRMWQEDTSTCSMVVRSYRRNVPFPPETHATDSPHEGTWHRVNRHQQHCQNEKQAARYETSVSRVHREQQATSAGGNADTNADTGTATDSDTDSAML